MEVLVGVAIGLFLTFAVVAVITSSVTELLSGLWRLRAHSLEMGIARLLDDQTKLARPKRFWPLVRPSTDAPVTQAVLQHPLISSLSAPRAEDRPPSYINAVTFATAFLGSPLTTASLVAKVTEDRDRLDARIGGLGAGQPGDTVRRAWTASGKAPTKLVVALLGDAANGIDGLAAVLGPAEEVEARIGRLRAAGDPATALIAETWQRATEGGGDHGEVADFLRKLGRPNLVTSALDGVQQVEDGLRELQQVNPHLGRSLAALWARAGDDFSAFRREVEDWFDHEMDRVSGWYTRWAQWIMVAVAFAVAISFNLSAVTIGKALWNDPTLRAQAAAVAEQQVGAASTSMSTSTTATTGPGSATPSAPSTPSTVVTAPPAADTLREIGLPFGWSSAAWPGLKGYLALHLLGIVLVAIAGSFGAPFWFDALNKLVNLRTTGRPPPTADAQRGGGPPAAP